MMQTYLTPSQLKVLEFIRREIDNGRPFPKRRAIQDHMGWVSESGAIDCLNALVGAGYVVRSNGKAVGKRRPPYVYTLAEDMRCPFCGHAIGDDK